MKKCTDLWTIYNYIQYNIPLYHVVQKPAVIDLSFWWLVFTWSLQSPHHVTSCWSHKSKKITAPWHSRLQPRFKGQNTGWMHSFRDKMRIKYELWERDKRRSYSTSDSVTIEIAYRLSILTFCFAFMYHTKLHQHCIKIPFRSLNPDGNQIKSFYMKAQLTFCFSVEIHFEMKRTEKQKTSHRSCTQTDQETERDRERESEWGGDGGTEWAILCLLG